MGSVSPVRLVFRLLETGRGILDRAGFRPVLESAERWAEGRLYREMAGVARMAGMARAGLHARLKGVSAGRSVKHQSLRTDKAVGERMEAGETLRVGVDPAAMVEVDQRAVLQHLRRHDGVVLEALRHIVGGARRGDRAVDLGIAIARIVDRAFAGHEVEKVAVGIDAAAPGEEEGVELAFLRQRQRGREFGRANVEE